MMKIEAVKVRLLRENGRLDAHYFLSPGVKASEAMAALRRRGLEFRNVGGKQGLGSVWAPLRFKRAYAAEGEPSEPYLRPYDAFEYLPVAADHLSALRTERLDTYRLREGTILQTCSGRNLGPALLVDKYLSRFILSHDMVRIEIPDEELRYFVLGFLLSDTGQELLKRDKTGSVIDHISDHHVSALQVPMLDKMVRKAVADAIKAATERRERARLALGVVTK